MGILDMFVRKEPAEPTVAELVSAMSADERTAMLAALAPQQDAPPATDAQDAQNVHQTAGDTPSVQNAAQNPPPATDAPPAADATPPASLGRPPADRATVPLLQGPADVRQLTAEQIEQRWDEVRAVMAR